MLFGWVNARCATCGYELDYSKHDELCPECGAPVLQSYSARGLAEIPGGALRAWRLGVVLRACSFWSLVVILAALADRAPGPPRIPPPPTPLHEMLWPPVASLLGIFGMWGGVLLTTGASALEYNPRWRFWRRATRWLMAVEAIAIVNAVASALLTTGAPAWPWALAIVSLSAGATSVARLGMLLCFVGNRRRGELACRLLLAFILPTVAIGLMLAMSPLVAGTWRAEGSRALLGVVFLALLVVQPPLRTLAFFELYELLVHAARKSETRAS